MDLFISLSPGDIFATKEVHFDLQHLRNGFRNTRDQQQNHLDTSWYCERLMMTMMFEVLMLLMIVINPRECLFWNRKQCCFCVCSLRVDVRMSAASGGKFCVNIFCFQDPLPPTLCGLYILPARTRNMLLQGSNWTTPSSKFNMCCWSWMQSLISTYLCC